LIKSSGEISFRTIQDVDGGFLRSVHAASRDREFRLTLWSEADKADFLARQFDLQQLHYHRTYPKAIFRIIVLDGVDIGRLYVDRQDDCLRLLEIGLLAAYRGRGIGTDILRSLLNEAHGGKVPVRLHAELQSPALRLYLRHGFRPVARRGHHLELEWTPDLRPREI
jgi:GNAT superfamily N-acetyltransferase